MASLKFKVVGSILFICLVFGCNSGKETIDKKFFNIKTQIWENYLTGIGIDAQDLNESVFLFVQSNSCSPCLKELSWWDNNTDNFNNVDVNLIVIEEFSSTYESFFSINDLNLPSHQDSTALAFEKELIPFVPVKLYFNNNAQVVSIERIGTDGNLNAFVEKIDME